MIRATLGHLHRDTVTGFEGIALTRHEDLNGVTVRLVGPSSVAGGEPPEVWAEECRLVYVASPTGRTTQAAA